MRLGRRSVALLVVGVAAFAAVGWFEVASVGMTVHAMEGSNSMSHADEELPNVLDPGEIATLRSVKSRSDVVTYFEGQRSGHRVGEDWGDVLVFDAVVAGDGTPEGIPFGHRAIAWVVYNASAGAYDVPEVGVTGARAFSLPDVGSWNSLTGRYEHAPLAVALDPDVSGRHDGFLTKGDHNSGTDQDTRGGFGTHGAIELVQVPDIRGRVHRHMDDSDAVALGGFALAVAVIGAGGRHAWRRVGRHASGARARLAPGFCAACGRRRRHDTPFCARCGAD